MKILITGGCGFVGANLALFLNRFFKVSTLDNLSRKGSKYNLSLLKRKNIKNYKYDIYNFKKLSNLPKFHLIIDCCAEADVEVSKSKIDNVINTNLIGTINILKKAKSDNSKLIFLSSSRVYPIGKLNEIIKQKKILKKKINITKKINEESSIIGPRSIYGLTKLASEMFIEEFAYAFNLKYLINRCGVISGPLQFGKQDQGFVSLWIWRHEFKKNLKYIGYGGYGNQIRDVLHIEDLCDLIFIQIKKINSINNKVFTVGGSTKSFTSLKNLTQICQKLTKNRIKIGKVSKTSSYDIPYYITNNNKVSQTYNWYPKKNFYDLVKDVHKWILINKKTLRKYF